MITYELMTGYPVAVNNTLPIQIPSRGIIAVVLDSIIRAISFNDIYDDGKISMMYIEHNKCSIHQFNDHIKNNTYMINEDTVFNEYIGYSKKESISGKYIANMDLKVECDNKSYVNCEACFTTPCLMRLAEAK